MKKLLLFLFLLPSVVFAQLELPYGVKVLNPRPLDALYYESDNTPYDSEAEVLSGIPSAIRYRGLTVNVNGLEYWFSEGITDEDLVVKIPKIGDLLGAEPYLTPATSFTVATPLLFLNTTDAIISGFNSLQLSTQGELSISNDTYGGFFLGSGGMGITTVGDFEYEVFGNSIFDMGGRTEFITNGFIVNSVDLVDEIATKADVNLALGHIADNANPHNVTKDLIGLDQVNNTSDLAKPISVAAQEALDDKADLTYTQSLEARIAALEGIVEDLIEVAAPEIDGNPTITGTAVVGNTLTAVPATTTGSGVAHTWQWERGGVAISGATNITYTLTNADYETNITVVQTSTNISGTDNAESSATAIAAQAEPTVQATNLTITKITPTSVNVSWTRGNGNEVLIVAREGGAIDATPTDGTAYTASSTYESGDQVGTGNYVIYQGTGTVANIVGLTPETAIHIRAFEVNNAGPTENYITGTATGNPVNDTTDPTPDGDYITDINLEIDGVPVGLGEDVPLIVRVDQPTAYVVTSPGATSVSIGIYDSDTETLVDTETSFTGSFNFDTGYKSYDLLITATGSNEQTRHYRRAIRVLPIFTEAEADYVINLDALMSAKSAGPIANAATASMVNGSTTHSSSAAHGLGVGDWLRVLSSDGKYYYLKCVTGTTGTTIVTQQTYPGPSQTIANANTRDYGTGNYNHPLNFGTLDATGYSLVNLLNKNGDDTGIDVRERPGYKIWVKGTLLGHLDIQGLVGDLDGGPPVHFIFDNAKMYATNNSLQYAIQGTGRNINWLMDGAKTTGVYGLELYGHPTAAGQVLFLSGEFNRGFEICGIKITGVVGANAASMSNQPVATEGCNYNTWDGGPLNIHHNYIVSSGDEGMYWGYFGDQPIASGRRAYQCTEVNIYRNLITNSGRDGIQPGGCKDLEIHDNVVDGAGLNNDVTHVSLISWNDGNVGVMYRNILKNAPTLVTAQTGHTGGDFMWWSNLMVNGTYTGTRAQESIFIAIDEGNIVNPDNIEPKIFNNTVISDQRPFSIYHWNNGSNPPFPESIEFFLGSNIITKTGSDYTYPELYVLWSPSSRANWTIDNLVRQNSAVGDIFFTDFAGGDYSLATLESAAIGAGLDIETSFPSLIGGYRDLHGYPLEISEGWTAGAYGGRELSTGATDEDAPGISVTPAASNVTNISMDITGTYDEVVTVYLVLLPDGASAPDATEVAAGTDGSGGAALQTGTKAGTSFSHTFSNLTRNTAYDIYVVGKDGGDNYSSVTKIDQTTTDLTDPIVLLLDIGSTYSTTTDNLGRSWNTTSTWNEGQTISLIDSDGNPSGFELEITGLLNSADADTQGTMGSQGSAGTPPSGYPSSVWRDYHSGGSGVASAILRGPDAELYTLTVKASGSRAALDNTRRGQVRVNEGLWVEYDGQQDAFDIAEVADVEVNEDDEWVVEVRRSQNGTLSTFVYLGFLEFELTPIE